MNVLHVIPSISLKYGGPSRTSVHLVNNLALCEDLNIHFYSYDCLDGNCISLAPSVGYYPQARKNYRLSYLIGEDYILLKNIIQRKNIDILHLHGVWHPLFHFASRAARSQCIPYIIQPRGMLEPWSIQFKRFKKSLAMSLYQRRDLDKAAGFIATSVQESLSLRALELDVPIAIIPNGVESASPVSSIPKKSSLKVALFMSRLHPKKGVLELIRSWSHVRPSGWELRIAGPDDAGLSEDIKSLVCRLNLDNCIKIIGPVYGEQRSLEFSMADLFILPTYSENFGIAVAEALSYGIPVITTTGAPWSSLLDYKCGWWIEPGEESLRKILPIATSVNDSERLLMGVRARALASKFDWRNVATLTKEFYSRIYSKKLY